MNGQINRPTEPDYHLQTAEVPLRNGYLGEMAVPKSGNTIRPIQIEQLNHGYVVRVGCQTFAIENPSTLIAKLAEYINNPAETEGKWSNEKLFS